jgi:hypothetical protein
MKEIESAGTAERDERQEPAGVIAERADFSPDRFPACEVVVKTEKSDRDRGKHCSGLFREETEMIDPP